MHTCSVAAEQRGNANNKTLYRENKLKIWVFNFKFSNNFLTMSEKCYVIGSNYGANRGRVQLVNFQEIKGDIENIFM